MILEPQETFGEWVFKLRKDLKISSNTTAHRKAGVYLYTLLNWEKERSIPQTSTLIRLVGKLSETTKESPQDIMDTIMESIPEWRRINGK